MSLRFAAALLALAAPAASFAQDRIILKNGKTIPDAKASQKIQVVDETIQKVTYRFAGVAAEQGEASARVERVEYGEKIPAYSEALALLRKGDLEDGVEKLNQVAEMTEPNWAKPYALFQIGEAYREFGEWDKAISAYNKLLTALPKSRFVPEARVDIAVCQFNKRDLAGAKATLQKLKEEAAAKGYPEEWINRAGFWETRMLEREGNYPEAITRYNSLTSKVEKDDPELANLCRLQIGECYSQQKDYKKALDFYKTIVENCPDQAIDLLAGAHLGMGAAYFNQKDYKAAREEFLRVIVLSDQHPSEVAAVAVVAGLYHAAQCFDLVKDNEADVRAQRLYREVVRTYPGSPLAAEARKRIR